MADKAQMIRFRKPQSRKSGIPPYFQFAHLTEINGLAHGVFTRRGGISARPFDSLNTSLSAGDDPAAVYANRKRIARALGAGRLVFPHQVHGRRVVALSTAVEDTPQRIKALKADGLATNQPGLWLAIQAADCQAVLLADPVRRVVANVHAGWRGSVENIVGRTVRTMARTYGCRPGDIRAGIGPSLGPCCAEFVNYREKIPKRWWTFKDTRHHFDFWAITREQLAAEGVLRTNIVISGMCTRCRPDLFFSYRQSRITGRFTAVIGWRETAPGKT